MCRKKENGLSHGMRRPTRSIPLGFWKLRNGASMRPSSSSSSRRSRFAARPRNRTSAKYFQEASFVRVATFQKVFFKPVSTEGIHFFWLTNKMKPMEKTREIYLRKPKSHTSTGTHGVPLEQNSLDCQDPRPKTALPLESTVAWATTAAVVRRWFLRGRSVGVSAQNPKSLRLRVFGVNLESHHFKSPNQ